MRRPHTPNEADLARDSPYELVHHGHPGSSALDYPTHLHAHSGPNTGARVGSCSTPDTNPHADPPAHLDGDTQPDTHSITTPDTDAGALPDAGPRSVRIHRRWQRPHLRPET